jgi:hypothetical protein
MAAGGEHGLLLGLLEAIKRNTKPGERHVERDPRKPTDLKIKN